MDETIIDNPDRNNDWKVNSTDYLEIKSQLLRSSKEQRKWLIENINLSHEWLVKLKDAFVEFTWVDIPNFKINHILKILSFNNSFNFFELNKAIELFGNEITPEKVLQILEYQPNFNFTNIIDVKKVLWDEFKIDNIIQILEIKPNLDFDILISLKNTFWDDFSIDKIIKILRIQKFTDFLWIIELKEYFWYELTLDKVVEILEVQPNFFVYDLINANNAFWEEFSIDKFINIIKNNPRINISNFYAFVKNEKWEMEVREINKLSPEKISLDEFINIYNIYHNIDILKLAWCITTINNQSIIEKNLFIKKYLVKLFDEDYTIPWSPNYLWNDNQFKSFFPKSNELKQMLDFLVDLQLAWLVKAWKYEIEVIQNDPSFINAREIIMRWLIPQESMEIKMIIARNLYFSRLKVNKKNVLNEYNKYLKNKVEYKNVSLFKDRNIVFTAHHEDLAKEYQTKDENKRFWRKATIEAIRKQWWNLPDENIIQPKNNSDSLKDAKNKILQKLVTTTIPMTFVFDWHGSSDAIYLSDWDYVGWKNQSVEENENTIKITYQEMAIALIERAKNKNVWKMTKKEQKDILIFSSCLNHTFIRNLYDELIRYNKVSSNKKKVSLPICIWEWEYGQTVNSNLVSNFWNDFFWKIMDFEWWDQNTTIWDIIENQEKLKDPSPYIYFPDKNNIPRQISQTEMEQTNSWTV